MQEPKIIGMQLRAARAVFSWSVRDLSERTGIGTATIKRYEASPGVPKSRKGHISLLKETFEAAGIEFVGTPDDAPGIRIHRPALGGDIAS